MTQHDFAYLASHERFLNPGDLRGGFRNVVFGTLLGSCVSITLWHPRHQFGCICHYILPTGMVSKTQDGRYGDSAFAMMQKELIKHGIRITECVAKIFGGGRMFSSESSAQDVGERNIEKARSLLHAAGLTITAENVGGDGYRRLYFDVSTGEVWIKFDWIDTELKDVRL